MWRQQTRDYSSHTQRWTSIPSPPKCSLVPFEVLKARTREEFGQPYRVDLPISRTRGWCSLLWATLEPEGPGTGRWETQTDTALACPGGRPRTCPFPHTLGTAYVSVLPTGKRAPSPNPHRCPTQVSLLGPSSPPTAG